MSALLFDFIAQIAAVPDLAALGSVFADFVSHFGFDTFALGEAPVAGGEPRFFLNNWPAEWLAFYASHALAYDDPIVPAAMQRHFPFTLSELMQAGVLATRQRRFLKVVAENGPWHDALVIPIHGPGPAVGIVSLVAAEVGLSTEQRASLHLVALYAYERARVLVGETEGPPAQPLSDLTSRERQCLEYVANGMSDGQIAQVLRISPTTVHYHVERARRKLDANNRAHAVAIAVRHGILWDRSAPRARRMKR